ncbi:hypothetical protein [Saccharopolyspora shandongensis]|nr:hypothetical protein [Saccharopolyspora shandongensis]
MGDVNWILLVHDDKPVGPRGCLLGCMVMLGVFAGFVILAQYMR